MTYSPNDPRMTFGEHLRAQRLAGLKQPARIEAWPEPRPDRPAKSTRTEPYAPPIERPAPRARDHIQVEAAARLRELREAR